jgi:hypothetical protein
MLPSRHTDAERWPISEHATNLQAEVVMQPAGGVLLYDEAQRSRRMTVPRFGVAVEVALAAVGDQ